MQGDEQVLDVGARAHLGGGTQQDAHLTGAHPGEQFLFLGLRIGFMNEGNFRCGHAHAGQLGANVFVYVECSVLALGGGYVRENKLRELAFPALAPDAVNVLHAGVDLAVGIIRQQRVD